MSREKRSWKVTEKGSVIVKARVKGPDTETPYGVIFRLVHAQATGHPLIMAQVCELTFDHNLNRAQYNFGSAVPTWFSPGEFRAFVEALEGLIPQEKTSRKSWGKETL